VHAQGVDAAAATPVLRSTSEVTLPELGQQVAAIVVVATVAGLLASVLPARRAARRPRWWRSRAELPPAEPDGRQCAP
jgi:hypothetical protein